MKSSLQRNILRRSVTGSSRDPFPFMATIVTFNPKSAQQFSQGHLQKKQVLNLKLSWITTLSRQLVHSTNMCSATFPAATGRLSERAAYRGWRTVPTSVSTEEEAARFFCDAGTSNLRQSDGKGWAMYSRTGRVEKFPPAHISKQ